MKSELNFDYQKATQAINFFAKKSRSKIENRMKVLKLIWIADRYHVRKYGRTITGDNYYAIKLGPIASTVKDLITGNPYLATQELSYALSHLEPMGKYEVKSIKSVDLDVFSESDIEALNFAYDNFGKLDEWDLSRLSHEYPEWKKFKTELESGNSTRENMNIVDFFQNTNSLVDDKFAESQELLDSSKELYEESIAVG